MELSGWMREGWNRWMWLCPLVALIFAAAVLAVWGLTLWSALVVALLLVCPAFLLWGVFYLGRHR